MTYRPIRSLHIGIICFFLGATGATGASSAVPVVATPSTFAEAAALLAAAVAATETARDDEALQIAQRIYRGPFPDMARFRAALLIADLYATEGRFLLAKFWARRAYEVADPQEKAAAAVLYQRIEAASPLSVSAQLAFSPSTNINNGGETKIIVIGGYPFEFGDSSLRLSGIEATGSLSFSYRLSQTGASLTEAFGSASFRKVWLNPAAAETAPEVSNSDFDQLGLSAGVRHSWQAIPGFGPTSASLSFGKGFAAGTQVSDWWGLEIRQMLFKDERRSLRVDLLARDESRLDSEINSSISTQASAAYQQALVGGKVFAAQFGVSNVSSASAMVDKDQASVSVSLGKIRLGPVVGGVGIDLAVADYPKWILTPGGRQDVSFGLGIEATFPSISFLGFSPTITVSARQTQSNIDIFDRETVSAGLSFSSSF